MVSLPAPDKEQIKNSFLVDIIKKNRWQGEKKLYSARTETHYHELPSAVFEGILNLLPVEFKLTKKIWPPKQVNL